MKNIDEFSTEIGLSVEQTQAVKKYILELLVDNLKSMKEEYNQEIDNVIASMTDTEASSK